jgi:hypothetical protein
MPASLRSAPTTATIVGPTGSIALPSGVEPGDVLLLVHVSDIATLADMTVDGGWGTPILQQQGPVSTGRTKVWRKTAGSEPSTYTVHQPAPDTVADGAVMLIPIKDATANGIVALLTPEVAPGETPLTTVATPAAAPAPSTGSSLDIRIAATTNLFSSTTAVWTPPTGFAPVLGSAQSRSFAAVAAASRQLASSNPVDGADFAFTVGAFVTYGITILVPSAGAPVPTPPPLLPFTPGRGISLYRYTVHDFISGAYKADIYPRNVYFDARIGEPGTFTGTLDIPNSRVAEQIWKVIPRTSEDLLTGPGRITIRIWRGGALWGEYWIHGARISRPRRGPVSIDLRGSTLDAYLLHATVSEDLNFEGEQVQNARDLLTHLQADPTAAVGFNLMPGTSGQPPRPLPVPAADDKSYGDALWGYSKAFGGFEWTVRSSIVGNSVSRDWVWGYPKITSDTVHTFQESPHGGDIIEWAEELDALRGGTRSKVRGGTPEATDATVGSVPAVSAWMPATDHLLAGWPRIDRLVDHPGQSTNTTQLDDFAARWIATFAGAVRVYSCSVLLGKNPSISPSSTGDQVKRVMVNVWHGRAPGGGAGFNMSQRLIGIGITPVSRDQGKEEAQLILEEPTV